MGKTNKLTRALRAELSASTPRALADGRSGWSSLSAFEQALVTDADEAFKEEYRYIAVGGSNELRFAAADHEVAHPQKRFDATGKLIGTALVAVPAGTAENRVGYARGGAVRRAVAQSDSRPTKSHVITRADGSLVRVAVDEGGCRVDPVEAVPDHVPADPATIASLAERYDDANRLFRNTPKEPVNDRAGLRYGKEHGVTTTSEPPPRRRKRRKPTEPIVHERGYKP